MHADPDNSTRRTSKINDVVVATKYNELSLSSANGRRRIDIATAKRTASRKGRRRRTEGISLKVWVTEMIPIIISAIDRPAQ